MTRDSLVDVTEIERARLDAAVLAEQISLLTHKQVDLPVNLIAAALVAVTFRRLYPAGIAELWLGIFLVVMVVRYLMRRRYRTVASSIATARHWAPRFTWAAFWTGCLWGLTGSIVLVTENPVDHLFAMFMLGCVMAGGIVTNSTYLQAALAFILPTSLPAILALVYRGDRIHVEMGIMLALLAVVLTVTGRDINRWVVDNSRLRISETFLFAELRSGETALAEAQQMAHVGSWTIDLQTNRCAWSAEAGRIFGVDLATFKPSYSAMLARIHPDDRANFVKAITTTQGWVGNHRLVMDNGTIKFVHEVGKITCDAQGRRIRMSGTLEDITEHRISDEKLELANTLFKTQAEASPDGMLVVDSTRKIISHNRRFADMWNIPAEDFLRENDIVVLTKVSEKSKDLREFNERVHYLMDHPGEESQEEIELVDGRSIERNTMSLTSAAGNYLGRVWFFHDVTEAKQAAATALRLARFDVLTGLPNRGVFVEVLQDSIERAKRQRSSFAVVYLDLDHFKDVNDTMGHPVGDALLQAAAGRLRANTRTVDTVARFGGDEFAIILADVGDPSVAAVLADKLIKVLRERYLIQGNAIFSGASGLSQRLRYYELVVSDLSTSNVWGVHLPSRL